LGHNICCPAPLVAQAYAEESKLAPLQVVGLFPDDVAGVDVAAWVEVVAREVAA
jgi:hypothetical protein